jgi:ferrous iron transport protein B
MSCHAVIEKAIQKVDLTVALAGNPNVGKSTLFNALTGLQAVTANYPGKTVELNLGVAKYGGKTIGVIDLPGTYSLDPASDDQWVARRAILEERPQVVVAVVDASNLQRNLYQTLQLIELEFPVLIALNLVDHAEKIGIRTDHQKLSKLLGAPAVPLVASKGQGLRELLEYLTKKTGTITVQRGSAFDLHLEQAIGRIEETIKSDLPETPFGLSARALAIRLLENDAEFTKLLRRENRGTTTVELTEELAKSIESEYHERTGMVIARQRHELAKQITEAVQVRVGQPPLLSQRLMHYAVSPSTGIPLALCVIAGIFAFMLSVGGFLGDITSLLWAEFASPSIRLIVTTAVGNGLISQVLLWGFDAGILAALSVGIPYVLTFYLVLSLLEDSGYLSSVAYLADTIMHKIGLHGGSIIPIIMGFGCNVPAIMGTRVLTTRRERILACTLITLTPCSARIAVIMAAVGVFAGWQYAAAIFGIDLLVIGAVGWSLNKLLPGKASGMVMEMFAFRRPTASTILKRTWFRFKSFMLLALPIITIGSVALGAFYETGYLQILLAPVNPIMYALLGLPAVASICLVLGILRKELTLQLLIALAAMQDGPSASNLLLFMSPLQLFVFGLVVTLYFPCVATMSVLGRELGRKGALTIMASTIALAILIGAVAYRVLPALGILA